MLGRTVVTIIKVTKKEAICLFVNKMVLTATMAEYKLEVANSAPHYYYGYNNYWAGY